MKPYYQLYFFMF